MGTFAISRRTAVTSIAGLALVAVVVLPGIAAERFDDGPGGVGTHPAKPHEGWTFLYEVITESRSAELGTRSAALDSAKVGWAGPPARAESVELVYQDGPFPAPTPPGGVAPSAGKETVTPLSSLGWVVWGSVNDGPRQMVGLLDYRTGRAAWDIRPVETS